MEIFDAIRPELFSFISTIICVRSHSGHAPLHDVNTLSNCVNCHAVFILDLYCMVKLNIYIFILTLLRNILLFYNF